MDRSPYLRRTAGHPRSPLPSLELGVDAALTSWPVRRFVVRLVAGILATAGLLLGAALTIAGSGDTTQDGEALTSAGLGALAAGLVCLLIVALVSLCARGAAERERGARCAQTTAFVREVRRKRFTRVGILMTLKLTVRFQPQGATAVQEHSRTIYVAPLTRIPAGREIAIAYNPSRPRDFVPLLR
jgi:hypothetical protein